MVLIDVIFLFGRWLNLTAMFFLEASELVFNAQKVEIFELKGCIIIAGRAVYILFTFFEILLTLCTHYCLAIGANLYINGDTITFDAANDVLDEVVVQFFFFTFALRLKKHLLSLKYLVRQLAVGEHEHLGPNILDFVLLPITLSLFNLHFWVLIIYYFN